MASDINGAFAEAAAKDDFATIVRLAKSVGKLADLATMTGIRTKTLKGIAAGQLRPSRNQGINIRGAVPTLIS